MLDSIINRKRIALEKIDHAGEISRMVEDIGNLPPVDSLSASLRNSAGISLIAEIKRRSPSKGLLAESLAVDELAHAYENSGARGISVLTETDFFNGSIDDLRTARSNTTLPILRKDFIIGPFQVYESRLIGADAILLITGVMPPDELANLLHLSHQIGLEVLIEIHDERELERILPLNPEMIGVNNRNLADFTVSLSTTERLAALIPHPVIKVSESGINCRSDVLRMQDCGIDAVLVGESIIKSPDREAKIRELLGTDHD